MALANCAWVLTAVTPAPKVMVPSAAHMLPGSVETVSVSPAAASESNAALRVISRSDASPPIAVPVAAKPRSVKTPSRTPSCRRVPNTRIDSTEESSAGQRQAPLRRRQSTLLVPPPTGRERY